MFTKKEMHITAGKFLKNYYSMSLKLGKKIKMEFSVLVRMFGNRQS